MVFNLPNFRSPHTQPESIADTTVAHEMVHLIQAQNSFFGDITGDGTSSANWFKEGLAEFIAGADNRVVADLERLAGYPNQSDQKLSNKTPEPSINSSKQNRNR